ncbi:MAG TPA: hypothetical protein VFT40_07730 [Sphingomicrobium sp.]|nr:hypothetical protein [Sphingomicrobium sp.]
MTLTPLKIAAAVALPLLLAAPASAAEVTIPFDADNFPDPPAINNITNQFWPLPVGRMFTYRAETPDGCEWSIVTVTPDTELITIEGETLLAREVSDFEYEDEACDGPDDIELSEKTFDWYAQDNAGNIWYMGEDTQNCNGENSCTPGSGRWKAGEDVQGSGTNAEPGIIMLATPTSGDSYRQEFYEGFAEDLAKIMGKNAAVELRSEDAISPGEWDNCLVTKEWNTLEGGSIEQKYYCVGGGVGLVLVTEHSGKTVRFEQVDPAAAAAAQAEDAFQFRKVPGTR